LGTTRAKRENAGKTGLFKRKENVGKEDQGKKRAERKILSPFSFPSSSFLYHRTRVGRITIGKPAHCSRRWSE
jgi:hypothetical protein